VRETAPDVPGGCEDHQRSDLMADTLMRCIKLCIKYFVCLLRS
jgi:hypothetical protein